MLSHEPFGIPLRSKHQHALLNLSSIYTELVLERTYTGQVVEFAKSGGSKPIALESKELLSLELQCICRFVKWYRTTVVSRPLVKGPCVWTAATGCSSDATYRG